MTLPKWMKYDIACFRSEEHCDEVDLDRLFKALEIALKALESLHIDCITCEKGRLECEAKEALRRIEELGK